MQRNNKKRKKIVLVMPYFGSLATFPAVVQAVRMLNKKYDFCIVTSNSIDSAEQDLFYKVYKLGYFKVRNIFTLPINSAYFSYFILKTHSDIVVCFTSDGIEAAFFSLLLGNLRKKRKYIYYNLEILTTAQYQGKLARIIYLMRKRIEQWYTNKADAFIIQDPIRYDVSKRYGINHSNVFFLPNTYSYRADIPVVPKVCQKVLYIGALEEWSIGDLMNKMQLLENIDITFAGWDRTGFLNKYTENLKKYPNVKIIEQQLNDEELDVFIQKYDIGLVYYSSIDDNIKNIGLSSGKFFKFLSMGKPVIVRNLPGMAEEVRKSDLGIVIDDVADLYNAYMSIKNKKTNWSEDIFRVYKEKYDYNILLNEVVERIEENYD